MHEGDFYNFPLEAGEGDDRLLSGINYFIRKLEYLRWDFGWQPDMLFVAAGADGHAEDPLTGLKYSDVGYEKAAQLLKEHFGHLPILIGGAGGYLPDSKTPETWSKFIGHLN